MTTQNELEYRTPRDFLTEVGFEVFTPNEISTISAKEIFNPKTFDELFHPIDGGLYDAALGPLDRFGTCATCDRPEKTCPGHFGHIVLPLPAYNPAFFRLTLEFLKGSCLACHRFYLVHNNSLPVELLLAQLRALNLGLVSCVDELKHVVTQAISSKETTELVEKEKADEVDPLMNTLFGNTNLETVVDLLDYLKHTYKEGESPPNVVRCRNVVQKRQELLQEFCKKYLFKRPRRCPHCKKQTLPVRHHYYQSILVGSKKKSWKTELLNTKKETLVKKNNFDDNMLANDDGGIVENVRRAANVDVLDEMKNVQRQLDELEADVVESLKQDEEEINVKEGGLVKNDGSTFLSPLEVKEHMRKVYAADGDFIAKIFALFRQTDVAPPANSMEDVGECSSEGWCPMDVLFYDLVPVIPSKFRPVNRMSGMIFENAQSAAYKKILESSQLLRHFVNMARGRKTDLDETIVAKTPGLNYEEKVHHVYVQLQMAVNILYDGDLDKISAKTKRLPGVRQILEKKEGLFRKHMMGKRVNYACRTVITPDPYQEIDQIGIPDIFAKKLTYPTFVNQINVSAMRNAVERGPDVINGANFVISESGAKVRLDPDDVNERRSLAKRLFFNDRQALKGCKKVLRHLSLGDAMLLNRQPTLHKPSIQAHRARILKNQKVMRLHYAVCKPYNADFDGDEMNAHFVQNDVARAEAYEIAAVPFQYLVPKDGTPVLGLIQDHIVSGVLLTLKDRFFSKEDYHYLVLNAFGYVNQKLKLLTPAIVRPAVRWTGKQVVSTVILNVVPDGMPALNLRGKAKTSVKCWQVVGHDAPKFEMSESETVFRGGELLSGVLDKADYGPTSFGLIHCCYEFYGPKVAARLLSCFSRLFTTFLQYHGFSLGVSDVLVSADADRKRKKILKKLRGCGEGVVREVFGFDEAEDDVALMKSSLEEVYSNVDTLHVKQLDYSMKTATDAFNDKVNKACLPHGLLKLFPENSLQVMIECGAKGNMVNQVQMSCMLGQIELEGCRPPLTPSGRTLPSFQRYDMSPRAGGFVDGRFATGIRPQEFFFHTMAGREGLIDTAVKTSRSGYLQRCIIKHLEGIVVNYDSTVRDSDKSVIQFQYGEDGLDIGHAQFLDEKRMQILLDNINVLETSASKFVNTDDLSSKRAEKMNKKIKKWKSKNTTSQGRSFSSAFSIFSAQASVGGDDKAQVVDAFRQLDEEFKSKLAERYAKRCPDPTSSKLTPSKLFGCLSENMQQALDGFVAKVDDEAKAKRFRKAFYLKCQRGLSEPGEAVGILAAQSIGEPSTQMTLNTFHFAGRGEMNVTLGIPRLREILMTASAKIATPTAQVPFRNIISKETAEKTQRLMDRIFLKQVLKNFKITEYRTITATQSVSNYVVELKFVKAKNRSVETKHLSNASVLASVEHSFFKHLSMVLRKKIEKVNYEIKNNARRVLQMADAGPSQSRRAGGDSDDEPEQMDADAADDNRRQKQDDETEYVGEAAEKMEVMPSEDEESGSEDEVINEERKENDMEVDENVDVQLRSLTTDAKRIQAVVNSAQAIISYDYDARRFLWCKANLQIGLNVGAVDVASVVKEEVEKFVVQQTFGVQRCLLREESGKLLLLTEGINLQSFFERADLLDVTKISCNDIHTISKTYGIEAAQRSLIKEIRMVFGAYGIQVDYRHLSLVSDYMTFTGAYMPFNRTYMNTSASPFQKMSFETTTNFLKSALYTGEKDDLQTPSSQLVVGKLPGIGTGCFDLMIDLNRRC